MVRSILRSISIFFLISVNFFPSKSISAGQYSTVNIQPQVTYTFGKNLVIQAELSTTSGNIKSGKIFLQPQGSTKINEADIVLKKIDLSSPKWQINYEQNLLQHPLRAFSNLKYWYALLLEDGSIITSQIFSFYYEDNRYTWQISEAAPFRFHWYEENTQLAQEVFNTARDGITRAQSILTFDVPQDINIYAYKTAYEVQSTLQTITKKGSAGYADPDLKVIIVSLPPGTEQRQEMARQVPHELMHILLYNKVGEQYRNLPVWFVEGLASMAELYPDPDYALLLQSAHDTNTLLPIQTLCDTFPQSSSDPLLAYAEATSFVRFLQGQFGSSGLEKLLQEYADGKNCERSFETAFGITIIDAENRWHRNIFEAKPISQEMAKMAPWLVIFFLILFVPLIIGIFGRNGFRQAMAHD